MSTDRLIVRIVVFTLAIVAVGGFVVLALCALTHTTVPDALDRYSFGALTALMALLSKTSTAPDEPQPVEVVNEPADPVPVKEPPLRLPGTPLVEDTNPI